MKITELFDRSVPWKWQMSPNHAIAVAMINGKKVKMTLFIDSSDTQPGSHEVDMMFDVDGRSDVTGGGDAVLIMSAVTNEILKYLNHYPVSKLVFTAKEASRARLYSAMCARLKNKIPYDLSVEQSGNNTEYVFVKRGVAPVAESLDRTADWRWRSATGLDIAETTVNGRSVKLQFDYSEPEVEILFTVDGETKQTHQGNSQEIFGIVTTAIVDYIKKRADPVYKFSAVTSEPKRVKLYAAMCARVVQQVPYTVTADSQTGQVEYVLIKNGHTRESDLEHYEN